MKSYNLFSALALVSVLSLATSDVAAEDTFYTSVYVEIKPISDLSIMGIGAAVDANQTVNIILPGSLKEKWDCDLKRNTTHDHHERGTLVCWHGKNKLPRDAVGQVVECHAYLPEFNSNMFILIHQMETFYVSVNCRTEKMMSWMKRIP